MVVDFGLQDHKWVREMYNKHHMCATSHISESVFAKFRTTSQCESLHDQLGRYVNYQNNLLKFFNNIF
jgi:cell fate (sporulation/competence/biofilm development) regulator YlbF (YheA/YmcA/DUF963 family)